MTALKAVPLEKLRQRLHVSVSQINTYQMCSEKYRHSYVVGTPPSHRPSALGFGSAVHHALAVFYGFLKAHGKKPSPGRVQAAFSDRWEVELRDSLPIHYKSGEDAGKVKDLGIAILKRFNEEGFVPDEVVAVEQPFSVTLPNPETGAILEEVLVGAIDLVAEHEGRTIIVEHKTAARKFAQDRLMYDLQPTAYQFAARELGVRHPGLAFQVLLKTRSPQVEFSTVVRTKEQETEMLSTYTQVLKAVTQGIFWKNRGWQCGDCQYRYRCDTC
ncbi:MAG: PD-(D/E)XK nuclease family protein [Deltaproteobacteria bacterium]|nr:PD-(D/E)XK nuclease family protein [Deltaproteobacteria bacterium]